MSALRQPGTRAAVTVTFLRMDARPVAPARLLPADCDVVRVAHPTVPFYRFLYDTVGGPHLWWLRRSMPDVELARLLADPCVSVHVLYRHGEPAGFFELDRRPAATNLSYFGLLPYTVGTGIGAAFLRRAVDTAWEGATRSLDRQHLHGRPRRRPAQLPAQWLPADAHRPRDLGHPGTAWPPSAGSSTLLTARRVARGRITA